MKNHEKIIEFQLENLDISLFENSDKIIKVKIEANSGMKTLSFLTKMLS